MWDYDKLFAEGNILGVKNCHENFIFNQVIAFSDPSFWIEGYQNNELSCKKQYVVSDKVGHSYTTDFEIQYIIRLDEHGNVVEKLFDRERDMKPEPEPMPELKTGMFVKISLDKYYQDITLGYIDLNKNLLICQNGDWERISQISAWSISKVIEVFGDAFSFNTCNDCHRIWRDPDYQAYLDSKSN